MVSLARWLLAAAIFLGSLHGVLACQYFIGRNIADGVADYDAKGKLIGTWPHAQIWNPAGSGKVLKISSLRFGITAWNGQTEFKGRGADIVDQTEPMESVYGGGNTRCKNIGDKTPSAAQMRVGHFTTDKVTGVGPFYELWPAQATQGEIVIGHDKMGKKITLPFSMGSSEDDREYPFDPPIEVPPGHGIAVRSAQPALYVVTSWQWQESTLLND